MSEMNFLMILFGVIFNGKIGCSFHFVVGQRREMCVTANSARKCVGIELVIASTSANFYAPISSPMRWHANATLKIIET